MRANSISGSKLAVGYLRRSTDRQEQSIGDQKQAIELYAANHDFEILEYYTDDAISGATSSERPAFLKLISDAKQMHCPFKFVLVYDIKRFGRVDNDEAGFYRHQLKTCGTEIIYVSEGLNGDYSDGLVLGVKQWLARQELIDLSKVTVRGQLSRVDAGWWAGGVPPFGYDLVYYSSSGEVVRIVRFMPNGTRELLNQHGHVERVLPKGEVIPSSSRDRSKLTLSSPDRVELVKRIFSMYLHDGFGYKGIAIRLNREMQPAPFGNNRSSLSNEGWCVSTVASILKNPIYTGDMVWNRTSFGKFHRIENGCATAIRSIKPLTHQYNDSSNWIVVPETHPAIITRAEFDNAQVKREIGISSGVGNGWNRGYGVNSPFLLTGLIECLNCGHNFVGYAIHQGRQRPGRVRHKNHYYVCNGYLTKGKDHCPRHIIPKDELEKRILRELGKLLRKRFATPEGRAELRQSIENLSYERNPQLEREIERLEKRLPTIRQTISNLVDSLSPTTREFVEPRLVELKQESVKIESQLCTLQNAKQEKHSALQQVERAIELATRFEEVFEEGSVEEKRVFLNSFIDRITIEFEGSTAVTKVILRSGFGSQVAMAV